MRWSRDTTTQTIRAIHPVVLCKVQILAPPNLKEKKMSKKHKKYIPEPKFEYTDEDILEVWEEIEESEPDISTEPPAASWRLTSMAETPPSGAEAHGQRTEPRQTLL